MPEIKIRTASDRDIEDVVSLWHAAGLTVPHNDPYEDIRFCRTSPHGELLLGTVDGVIVATVLVGHEGHHGWIYYVAVDPDQQGQGHGTSILAAGEAWLSTRDVPNANLMIRETTPRVRAFYGANGYTEEPRLLMSKRFVDHTGWKRQGLKSRDPNEHAKGQDDLLRVGRITTTVTYLEMLARPTQPTIPAPMKPKTSLIRAANPTVGFYRFLYDTVGAPWIWMERRLMDDEALTAAINASGVEIYVLWVDGVPAGFGEINRGIESDEVELSYFGLIPDFIGIGLGWYFLNAIIHIAWANKPKRLWVHTCDLDHPRAISIYQKAGFRVFGQAQESLPDPRAAGLPLPRPLNERNTSAAATGQPQPGATVTSINSKTTQPIFDDKPPSTGMIKPVT
jgi:GNAT superfamily N-acetyltransferase